MQYNSNGKAVNPIDLKSKVNKDLIPNEEDVSKMMDKHNKRSEKIKLKAVPVENDPFNTVFYMSENKNPAKRLSQYKEERSYVKFKGENTL